MDLRTDFTSQDYLRNPAAGLEKLRAAGPIVQTTFPLVGKVWITTTQEMAARVLKDSETFTLRRDDGRAGLRWWMPGIIRAIADNMLTMDEPDHTRLRGIVDEAFRRRAILDMSRASWPLPTNSPGNCLPTAAPPIWSNDIRASCRFPLFASCSVCRRPTGRSSSPGPAASRVLRALSASSASFQP
jgi:cytochrome P450 PksS